MTDLLKILIEFEDIRNKMRDACHSENCTESCPFAEKENEQIVCLKNIYLEIQKNIRKAILVKLNKLGE